MFTGVLGRAEHHSPWNSSMDGGKDVAWLDPAPCGLGFAVSSLDRGGRYIPLREHHLCLGPRPGGGGRELPSPWDPQTLPEPLSALSGEWGHRSSDLTLPRERAKGSCPGIK